MEINEWINLTNDSAENANRIQALTYSVPPSLSAKQAPRNTVISLRSFLPPYLQQYSTNNETIPAKSVFSSSVKVVSEEERETTGKGLLCKLIIT